MKTFLIVLFLSSSAFANTSISEKCTPKMTSFSGDTFSGTVLEPSSVACALERLSAYSGNLILIEESLSGVTVITYDQTTQSRGTVLFHVWDVETLEQAVPLFCDESLAVELVLENPKDPSIRCSPQKSL
jgi:hypothetical protein